MRRALTVLLLLVVGAAVGVAGDRLAGRHARSPATGPLTTPIVCQIRTGWTCFQLGKRVHRPIRDDDCWRDPDGGQGYVWEPAAAQGPASLVYVCSPTV